MDIEKLLKDIRESRAKKRTQDPYAQELTKRIMHGKHTNAEWLKLEEEVQKFLKSDASESDKKYVCGYTECLGMMCNAIREGRM